jgi:DNA-binding transcriptional ArsR family regulator
MGATNVSHVYAFWSHLPAPSKVLLTYMALVTRDDQDPPLFDGGRDVLALALGRDLLGGEFTNADKNAVTRALAPLKASGVVTVAREPFPGRSARYALHLLPEGNDPGHRLWMTARLLRELRREHKPVDPEQVTAALPQMPERVTPALPHRYRQRYPTGVAERYPIGTASATPMEERGDERK